MLAHASLVVQSFIIGLSFYFLKVGLKYTGNDAFDVVSYRFTAALVGVLALWAFGVGRPTGIGRRDWLSILAVSITYPVLFFWWQTLGVANTSASISGMLYAITPVVTLIGAAIFIRERTSIWQMVGIGISIVGLAFMVFWGNGDGAGSTTLLGAIYILLSVGALAAYFITVRRVSQRVDAMKLTCAMLVVGAIVFNIVSIVRHARTGSIMGFFTPMGSTEFIWASLYLGLLSSLFASWVSNFALKWLPAAMVSVYNNVIPVGAVLGGYFLLNERIYQHQLLGTLIVIIGVSLVLFSPQGKGNTSC